MLIKQPQSNNALENLWNMLHVAETRINVCHSERHDFTAIFYISSLIISPSIVHNNTNLINQLTNTVHLSPRNVICLIRTNVPNYFTGNVRGLQQRALNSLRSSCYVVAFDPRGQFLNHAKFVIFYHACSSERIFHYGKYYGSTNLTSAGLSHSALRVGNYEEFQCQHPRPKYRLGNSDKYYINEVKRSIEIIYNQYVKSEAARYLRDHLRLIYHVLRQAQNIISNTTLGQLYEAYINLVLCYYQTISLLWQLPGKKLTTEIIERMEYETQHLNTLPFHPFELEPIIPHNTAHAEQIASILAINEEQIRGAIDLLLNTLEESINNISRKYREAVHNIIPYLDEHELQFYEVVQKYGSIHLTKIQELLHEQNKLK